MALTETTPRQSNSRPGMAPRSLLTRLSLGHVVMILAGLVAILLNLAFLRSDSESIRVIVAAESLPAGSVLTEGATNVVAVGDPGALADGLITADTASAIYGATLARQLAPGDPVRQSDLRPDGTPSALREFSLELDAAQAAGGRIGSSDIVDVIATFNGRSFYVASSVEVISVVTGGSALDVGDDLIVVLAVDDQTALEIASARSIGTVAVVRATGAAPPTAGPVDIVPSP